MKYSKQVEFWRERLAEAVRGYEKPVRIMEVCGSHTNAIAQAGLRSLLPENVRLISGPGCPVCVSGAGFIEEARKAGALPGVMLMVFGDLLPVPGASPERRTLAETTAAEVIYSPEEALEYARLHPERHVVFAAVGFDPTLSATAGVLAEAAERQVKNFSLLSDFKRLRPVLELLVSGEGENGLSGFLLPGHVAAVCGEAGFEGLRIPGVISGFEPENILHSLLRLLRLIAAGNGTVENNYTRVVGPRGNPVALGLIEKFFEPAPSVWRGFGEVGGAGWNLRPQWREFDAFARWNIERVRAAESPLCRCGEVLRGRLSPENCGMFGHKCTPEHPVGACMVSSEGACQAAYRYREAGLA
ncbi:MAG: Hydrogenase isoenzymes formation protein HypD [Lentisphaerae bacterium ADurb.Bin242]|nr:MAG: Hydrogenase isoenzymes formation protein HypD [Lentisphaerae bacterium ADurb.Bin242]